MRSPLIISLLFTLILLGIFVFERTIEQLDQFDGTSSSVVQVQTPIPKDHQVIKKQLDILSETRDVETSLSSLLTFQETITSPTVTRFVASTESTLAPTSHLTRATSGLVDKEWMTKMRLLGRPVKSKRRVICTVVRDMTKYIKEWLHFHLLVGWDKFVFYDHLGKDGLKSFLETNFHPDVFEYVNITWYVPPRGNQRMSNAQTTSFSRCFEKYWELSEALATTDVDEFMYPAPSHWSEADALGASFRAMGYLSNRISTTSKLSCIIYGFGPHLDIPDAPVIYSYTHRAPVNYQEKPETAVAQDYQTFCRDCDYENTLWCHDLTNRTIPYCRLCRFCIHVNPLTKILYFPNNAKLNLSPKIHWAVYNDKHYIYDDKTDSNINRTVGVLCNHYRYRSFNDVTAKAIRNVASKSFTQLPRNHSYFEILSSVKDTTIWEFIDFRKSLLRTKYNISIP
jgi:hypothetical protein